MSNLTIEGGVRWERQESLRPRSHVGVRPEEELGAAHRLHLRSDERRQGEDLRPLRPVLREHPDGHQHPRVRRRVPVLLLQLLARSGELSGRMPTAVQVSCSAAPSRSIRTSRVSTSTSPGRLRARDRAALVLAMHYNYRNLGRVIEDFLVPSSGEYFIANPGEGTLGRASGSTTAVNAAPAPKAGRVNKKPRVVTPQAVLEQLAVPRELRVVEARRQLRRHVPELHRPARSEHQLGVRLRRLPGQRRRPADQRPHAPAQAGRQLPVEQRAR